MHDVEPKYRRTQLLRKLLAKSKALSRDGTHSRLLSYEPTTQSLRHRMDFDAFDGTTGKSLEVRLATRVSVAIVSCVP